MCFLFLIQDKINYCIPYLNFLLLIVYGHYLIYKAFHYLAVASSPAQETLKYLFRIKHSRLFAVARLSGCIGGLPVNLCVIMRKLNLERKDIKEWLNVIRQAQQAERKPLYGRVYELSAVPTRRRVAVNLYTINKHTKEGENVIVPGKVLGDGPIAHRVNIAAMSFSTSALKNLKDANCKIVSIKEMLGMSKPRILV